MKRYVKLSKEYKDLERLVATTNRYRKMLKDIDDAKEVLETESDEELRELAKEDIEANTSKLAETEEEIKLLLIPEDPEDDRNAVVEIRGGTGGDEAAIFAGDLFRMYTKYCEMKGWHTEVSSFSEGASGGYKEIIFTVTGEKVYGTLKYESGVHRVKRVPATAIILVIGRVIAILIQKITSEWMDVISIYICPLGALLAGIMFFWVAGKKFVLDEVNDGRQKPIGGWFYPLAKYVYCILCIVALVAGAALGGIG